MTAQRAGNRHDHRKLFTVRQEHLNLAHHMRTRYEDGIEFGAPAIDPKRPYGNSDVYGDMREILGRPDATDDELLALHQEMTTVLQIALRIGLFRAGQYVARLYYEDWRPIRHLPYQPPEQPECNHAVSENAKLRKALAQIASGHTDETVAPPFRLTRRRMRQVAREALAANVPLGDE